MDIYMPMGTSIRHNKITMTISSAVVNLLRTNDAHASQEECMLVHWGKRRKSDFKYLVDIDEIGDVDDFAKTTINDLDFVQPDFMLFKKNKYVCNERETRTAGCPDLIIEVWSKDNSKAERKFKFDLYSTSSAVEHWYIEQDLNEVICYLGQRKLKNQYLSDILVTLDGLEFDLRYLAK
jgi:hypothetical protein